MPAPTIPMRPSNRKRLNCNLENHLMINYIEETF